LGFTHNYFLPNRQSIDFLWLAVTLHAPDTLVVIWLLTAAIKR